MGSVSTPRYCLGPSDASGGRPAVLQPRCQAVPSGAFPSKSAGLGRLVADWHQVSRLGQGGPPEPATPPANPAPLLGIRSLPQRCGPSPQHPRGFSRGEHGASCPTTVRCPLGDTDPLGAACGGRSAAGGGGGLPPHTRARTQKHSPHTDCELFTSPVGKPPHPPNGEKGLAKGPLGAL